jgi:hypothetical protein
MSFAEVWRPFWVDMNVGRIAGSWRDRWWSAVQQVAVPDDERFVDAPIP